MANRGRRALAGRLVLIYAVAVILVLGTMGFFLDLAARRALLVDVEEGVTQQALAVAELVPDSGDQAFVDAVARNIDARVTLIGRDGAVVGDSLRDPESLENHADRPEVRAALAGAVGTDNRLSESTGFRQFYVAVPTGEGRVLRLSLPENTIEGRVGAMRRSFLVIGGLAALAGVVAVAIVGRRLARPLTRLAEAASGVAAGDLSVSVPRSSVEELDRLGQSIVVMASELGRRLAEVEGERHTLGAVLDALPQGTLLVGATDDVLYANRSLGNLLGPAPDRLDQVVPFRIQELVRRARREGGPVEDEFDHGRPARVLRASVFPFDDGRALAVVGDITERHQLDAVRRDFVTNASHELKTPVASILASAETLQVALERAPDRVPQFAEQIEHAARSLAGLIADLLDLSRLESQAPSDLPVDLVVVVDEVVAELSPTAEERGVALTTELQAATVTGSAADLALAVRNVVDNALRYTEAGGSVSVRLESREGEAFVTVADTGAGIPSRELERIFERFYRVDEARSRATGGTGLGLSIVRHVVESHGGRVTVHSELGAGSTFTLALPLAVPGDRRLHVE